MLGLALLLGGMGDAEAQSGARVIKTSDTSTVSYTYRNREKKATCWTRTTSRGTSVIPGIGRPVTNRRTRRPLPDRVSFTPFAEYLRKFKLDIRAAKDNRAKRRAQNNYKNYVEIQKAASEACLAEQQPEKENLFWFDYASDTYKALDLESGTVSNVRRTVGKGKFVKINWDTYKGYYRTNKGDIVYEVALDGSSVKEHFNPKDHIGEDKLFYGMDVDPVTGDVYVLVHRPIPDSQRHQYDNGNQFAQLNIVKFVVSSGAVEVVTDDSALGYITGDPADPNDGLRYFNEAEIRLAPDVKSIKVYLDYVTSPLDERENSLFSYDISSKSLTKLFDITMPAYGFGPESYVDDNPSLPWVYITSGTWMRDDYYLGNPLPAVVLHRKDTGETKRMTLTLNDDLFAGFTPKDSSEAELVKLGHFQLVTYLSEGEMFGWWVNNFQKLPAHMSVNWEAGTATISSPDGKLRAEDADINLYIENKLQGIPYPDGKKILIAGKDSTQVWDRTSRAIYPLMQAQLKGEADVIYTDGKVNSLDYNNWQEFIGEEKEALSVSSADIFGLDGVKVQLDNIFDDHNGEKHYDYRKSDKNYYWIRKNVDGNGTHLKDQYERDTYQLVKAPADNLGEITVIASNLVIGTASNKLYDKPAGETIEADRYRMKGAYLAVDEESGIVWIPRATFDAEYSSDVIFLAFVPQADGSYVVNEIKSSHGVNSELNPNNATYFSYDVLTASWHYSFDDKSNRLYFRAGSELSGFEVHYFDLSADVVERGVVTPKLLHSRKVFPKEKEFNTQWSILRGTQLIYSRLMPWAQRFVNIHIRNLTEEELKKLNESHDADIQFLTEDGKEVEAPVVDVSGIEGVHNPIFLTTKLQCPTSGKLLRGVCGCDTPDEDKDLDGVIDCKDSDKGAGINVHFDALKKQ